MLRIPLFVCFAVPVGSKTDAEPSRNQDENEMVEDKELGDEESVPSIANPENDTEYLRSALAYKADRCSPTLSKDTNIPSEYCKPCEWIKYFILTGEGIEAGMVVKISTVI